MQPESHRCHRPLHAAWSALRPAASGFVLPLVLVTGLGAHLALVPMLEASQLEMRAAAAHGPATQSLADAERALRVARARLESDLNFPASGCVSGLCANLGAPAGDAYDWVLGTVHQTVTGVSGGGWWIESLGQIAAGTAAGDCNGSGGGCEYVRATASAAPYGVRRTLEACYRIRRAAGLAPVVTRVSWRQSRLP